MTPENDHDPIEGEYSSINDDPEVEIEATSRELSQDEIDERVHEESKAQSIEYQRIFLPEGATKVDAIMALQKEIPQNEFGLPLFFYRSDLLPYDLSALSQHDADACVVDLSYDEGYPTYNNGHVFWQQLPYERLEDFLLFQRFCDQAEQTGVRTLHMLAHDNSVSLSRIQTLYHEYFWKARVRAYDLFQVASDRKLRERRARRLEDNHYTLAQDLMVKLTAMLEQPDMFENMKGKEALECLRLLINIQRVSNGLPQNGNAGVTPFNPDAAMDTKQLMEDITKTVQRDDTGLGLGGGLAELLKDPSFAFEAQRIVLRVRHQNDPNAQSVVSPVDEGF